LDDLFYCHKFDYYGGFSMKQELEKERWNDLLWKIQIAVDLILLVLIALLKVMK
jgi:hypothetical protein